MMDWKTESRITDRVALVGTNPRTRMSAPFNDPAYEVWTLNEAGTPSDSPRFDRLFQLHPRWDWDRVNNASQPNHPLWLKNQVGPCIFCKGVGVIMVDGANRPCPYCKEGIYTPPDNREAKLIYMQKDYPDVPGCVRLPFEEMVEKFCWDGVPYFTSTFSYMLVFAMLMGFPEIEIYGFEMESSTEYFHQRACAEYWIGNGRARGFKITAPGAGILKGELYAYNDQLQGFRQYMESRKGHLQQQYQQAINASNVSLGRLEALTPFKDLPDVAPAFQQAYDQHYRNKVFAGALNGAIMETGNLIGLFDAAVVNAPSDDSIDPHRPSIMEKLGLLYKNGPQ